MEIASRTSHAAVAARPGRLHRRSTGILLGVEVCLLVAAGWRNPTSVFPDTIAYLRIAQYYATGQFDLALSGYWGPLISWLIVPLLRLGLAPLLAARLVLGASALLFLCASLRLLRTMALPGAAVATAMPLLAVFCACWSVVKTGPDLLVGAFLLLGLSLLIEDGRDAVGRRPLAAGLCFGAAYLAKAVALPVSCGLILGLAAIRALTGSAEIRLATRAALWAATGLMLVATPWIVVLSLHYGQPTFSTTATISHAIVAPDNPDYRHPVWRSFHAPEPGRITDWEEPSRMTYDRWSPFDSRALLAYETERLARNVFDVIDRVGRLDVLHLGLVAAVLGFLLQADWRRGLRLQPWRLAGPAIVVLAGIYVPVFADEDRYYLACFPLLLAAALGFSFDLAARIAGSDAAAARRLHTVACVAVALSFLGGMRLPLRLTLTSANDIGFTMAEMIAPVLDKAGVKGAIVSASDWGVAYYLAYLTGQQFYGDNPYTTNLDDVVKSGADILLVEPSGRLGRILNQSPPPAFEPIPLGLRLPLPVRVYRVHR